MSPDRRALAIYWREIQPHAIDIDWLAYSATLLYGLPDGYPPVGKLRCWIARQLRRLALRVEKRK